MPESIKTYDSNTRRKANKPFHQLSKNILEKNNFAKVGIVEELNKGESPYEAKWCKVKLIPTIEQKEFLREEGYNVRKRDINESAIVFIPKDLAVAVGDVVLVIFTDNNFKKAIIDILKGYSKDNYFYENDITTHSTEFGIVTRILL